MSYKYNTHPSTVKYLSLSIQYPSISPSLPLSLSPSLPYESVMELWSPPVGGKIEGNTVMKPNFIYIKFSIPLFNPIYYDYCYYCYCYCCYCYCCYYCYYCYYCYCYCCYYTTPDVLVPTVRSKSYLPVRTRESWVPLNFWLLIFDFWLLTLDFWLGAIDPKLLSYDFET